MDSPIKVSVVIPMYNCAEYIPGLFDSLLNQTLESYELICVIDGATDDTLEIIRQYAQNDNRVRCFYKENGGAGSARNYGMKYARGEYIIFIDADDEYSRDFLGEMVQQADQFHADLALCLYQSEDFRTGIVTDQLGFRRKAFPENECVDPHNVSNVFQAIGPGPTNKLYRRQMIEDNNLVFSETHIANDVFFIFSSITLVNRAVGVHKHLIKIRKYINPSSLTASRVKYSEDFFVVYSQLYHWLCEKGLFDQYRKTYFNSFFGGFNYNATFGINPCFVEAAVRTFNEELPWSEMRQFALYNLFSDRFNTKNLRAKIRELEHIGAFSSERESQSISLQLAEIKSLLANISIIEALSEAKYNRRFERDLYNDRRIIELERELVKTKSSWNYRIGSILTWFPKKIYYLIKK